MRHNSSSKQPINTAQRDARARPTARLTRCSSPSNSSSSRGERRVPGGTAAIVSDESAATRRSCAATGRCEIRNAVGGDVVGTCGGSGSKKGPAAGRTRTPGIRAIGS
eukprot:7380573-Prymnesium_polylepis.1